MRIAMLITAAMLAASCAPVPPAAPVERVIPAGPPPQNYGWDTSTSVLEQDLLATARERFGEPMVRRALSAPAYLIAKFYHGMLPPPEPGAPPYKPPMAMLVREDGQWLVATAEGVRPARPDKVAELEAMLASPAFWSAPPLGTPQCTDAGASLLMLKLPGRAETVRNGTCGPTQPNEQLVRLALEM